MIDWTPYLESVCTKYAKWGTFYTLTDVEGKTRPPKTPPLLRDLWVPSIEKERENPQKRAEKPEKTEIFTVLEGLRKYAANHVLLVGRPGSGKSTALARLLLEESQKLQDLPLEARNQSKIPQIPILIELRYYDTSILDLILQFLKEHGLNIDSNSLESWLFKTQNFTPLLLLDGINELPSGAARLNLHKFRRQYAKIPMIFTTRDIGIGGDLNIEKKLEMLPLTEPQMQNFVHAYLPEKGELMLTKLGNRLKEFGQTPLLLWMLCSVFKSNENQIPANLGLVIRDFTEIYGKDLKQDVSTYQESRDWWRELLQVLAWKMTEGNSKTEIQVALSKREAERIFREYLQGKVEYADNCAKQWFKDLLKHHLIQLEGNEQIAFRHQLIQEYYAAEALLEKLPYLSDEALQWDYLNYLKWTEPVALMLGMLNEKDVAIRVVKLAVAVDVRLGARLAGDMKKDWQREAVELIWKLNLPQLFSIKLLGITRSFYAIIWLIIILEKSQSNIDNSTVESLVKNNDKEIIYRLGEAIKNSKPDVPSNMLSALYKINAQEEIDGLFEMLKEIGIPATVPSVTIEVYFSTIGGSATIIDPNQDCSIPEIPPISELIRAMENPDPNIRSKAIRELCESICSEKQNPELITYLNEAILKLVQLINDSNDTTCDSVANALVKISSEEIISQLNNCLKNYEWVTSNDGGTFYKSIEVLDAIQNKLKYYHPLPKPMPNPLSNHYALLIGVGECEHRRYSLPVTVTDVQALKNLLTDTTLCGYLDDEKHLRLLHNKTATKQAILDGLNWLKQQAENSPEATILVYYSGHGWLDKTSNNYYLIPHDIGFNIAKSALPAQEFNNALRQIPAQRLLVIIDSCHAQGMATSKDQNTELELPENFTPSAPPKSIIDDLKQGQGRAVFTSSTGEQSSWILPDNTMSIYTYHFLEALQGAGNQPGDKAVKISDLMNYVSKTVPASTQQHYQKEQTPFFDFATEDFPVALLRGGKGLPSQGWEEIKQEAEEKIKSISIQATDSAVSFGDGSVAIKIGSAEVIKFGDISAGKGG